jgi:signal transduction histidine kinase
MEQLRMTDQSGNKAFEKVLAGVADELSNAGEEQFDDALTESLRKLVECLEFDRSTVMMFSEHGRHLTVTHCWAREGIVRLLPKTPTNAVSWYTHQIRLGHIIRMSNIADLPADATEDRSYVLESGVKSTISIPLTVQETVVGAVGFATFREERRWPAEMVWRLRLVGEILALAILRHKNAVGLKTLSQTVDQMSPARMGVELEPKESRRRLAVDLIQMEHQERLRISDVLHEDVMQMLIGIRMFMERLEEADGYERADLIVRTKKLIHDAVEKLRKVATDLRPETLSKRGLVEGLRTVVEQMRQTTGLSVDFRAGKGIEPVQEEAATFLYSAACKLLDNIAAHSRSSLARVDIERIDAEHVRLAVSDEGAGFDLSGLDVIPSESFGLFSIREEAELLGGCLEVTSSPGIGTRAIVTVPG